MAAKDKVRLKQCRITSFILSKAVVSSVAKMPSGVVIPTAASPTSSLSGLQLNAAGQLTDVSGDISKDMTPVY